MLPRQRQESEYVEIGIPWLAAILLCVVAFPEADELRSLLGPLVMCLYAVAVLFVLAIAICRTAARAKRRQPSPVVLNVGRSELF